MTSDEIIAVMKEWGDIDVETEHRKYGSFYATATLEITGDVVEEFKEDYDIIPYLNHRFVATGYWSDEDGLDLYDSWIEEKEVTVIPEQIIPAHEKINWRKIGE